jgi:hypothetical protein
MDRRGHIRAYRLEYHKVTASGCMNVCGWPLRSLCDYKGIDYVCGYYSEACGNIKVTIICQAACLVYNIVRVEFRFGAVHLQRDHKGVVNVCGPYPALRIGVTYGAPPWGLGPPMPSIFRDPLGDPLGGP